jgi:hypothetical protein
MLGLIENAILVMTRSSDPASLAASTAGLGIYI